MPKRAQKPLLPLSDSRKGKGLLVLGADAPVQKLPVNLADARSLFMSILVTNWKQVTDTMKKIWRIRGEVCITPLPGYNTPVLHAN
jgi:hypothetical protein